MSRSRLCKVCGGWHSLEKPWPHNCREPQLLPPQKLAAPMIAPPFGEFRTGVLDGAEFITNRSERREYMKKHDLVDYDPGVSNAETWVDRKRAEKQYVQDFKRAMETDPLNIEPVERIGESNLEGAGEISTDTMEVAK